jgi:REP element-mobilizing transposase RayT
MKTSNQIYYPAGIYHVTWVTHNSRTSQRMIDPHVKAASGIRLDDNAEEKITEIIADIVCEKKYMVYAFNICRDHIHMLIKCDENTVGSIIRQIKGKSTQLYKEHLGKSASESFHLWAQKFNKWLITTDEELRKTTENILYNRKKHGFPENKGLQPLVLSLATKHIDNNAAHW